MLPAPYQKVGVPKQYAIPKPLRCALRQGDFGAYMVAAAQVQVSGINTPQVSLPLHGVEPLTLRLQPLQFFLPGLRLGDVRSRPQPPCQVAFLPDFPV